MTTIIGVDPSLAGTGLVTWRDGRFYVATVSTPSQAPAANRHHTIAMRMIGMRDPDGATLITMEGRITPSSPEAVQTAMDLAELRGVLNVAAYEVGIAMAEVHPATLKVYGAGRGDASKQDMVFAARGRLGCHLHVTNDNEADAAWLTAITLDHYGRPLWSPPQKNRAAVARVKWPATFTLDKGEGVSP